MTEDQSARTWLTLFGVGFLICSALLLSSLLTPVAYGDLTRIGRISEKSFGWNKLPPPVQLEHLKTWPIQEADILVIGDSFSARHIWQSVLVGAGYKVATTHWDTTGPLCKDFAQWLERSGFRGKLVVAESIERLLEERVEQSSRCATMKPGYTPVAPPAGDPSLPPPHLLLNWNAQLLTGWLTYRNTREILKTDSWTNIPERRAPMIDARVVPRGCEQFSHVVCDKLLVTAEDRLNPPLTAESARLMAEDAARAKPYRMVWMVIPNKSTVYLDPDHGKDFMNAFAPLNIGPDLFALAQDNRFKVRDLFPANETHVSTAGYLVLGRRMLDVVREILPTPSLAAPSTRP